MCHCWFFRHYLCCLQFVVCASQCSFEFNLELPNCLALIPFRSVSQPVLTCRSPSGPGLLIYSGVEAFWHIWIVQRLLEQEPRTHPLPISGVRPKSQLTSGSLDWRLIVQICFRRNHWLGFYVFPTDFLRISYVLPRYFSRFGLLMFLNVRSASPRMRGWKKFILFSSMTRLWTFKLVSNRSSNS